MTADDLVPCAARSSNAVVLTASWLVCWVDPFTWDIFPDPIKGRPQRWPNWLQDKWFLMYHQEGFQLPSSQFWEMIETASLVYSYVSQNKLRRVRLMSPLLGVVPYHERCTWNGMLLYRYGNAMRYSVRMGWRMMILLMSLNSFQSSSLKTGKDYRTVHMITSSSRRRNIT